MAEKEAGPEGLEPGYDFEEARQHLLERFAAVAAWSRRLPEGAAPNDYLVIKVVLHPDRLARAHAPRHFLSYLKFSVLGSHQIQTCPKKGLGPAGETVDTSPADGLRSTICLFVAGRKENFALAAQKFRDIRPDSPASRQMTWLETVSPLYAAGHIKTSGQTETDSFEATLHLLPEAEGDFPGPEFCDYAEKAGFTVHREHCLKTGGLMFVPLHGPRAKLLHLAQFVFIREIKEAGRLRGLTPPEEAASGRDAAFGPVLPEMGPASTGPKVALLDAGLPPEHLIGPWLNKYVKSDPDQPDMEGGPEHGLAVASSFLFGPLPEQGCAARPLAPISFYRVLDAASASEDGLAMFHTLANIQKALAEGPYDFVNLSLGPDLPARDDTVHAWTAILDELAGAGKIFFTLAVGNNGGRDRASGAARIEVPSDCVNAVGVGATDSRNPEWNRADYSAVGPGRSPDLVKPDLMAFGGRPGEYFRTLAPGSKLAVANEMGTSFASPYLLRSAVALSIMGSELSLLSIKCLLIHYADQGGHGLTEVGWGRAPVLDDLEAKPRGNAPLIFQGQLASGNFLRADLPTPADGSAIIKLKATFCYAPPVAAHDALAYTQAALDISFVPNMKAPPGDDGRPPSRPFFDLDGGGFSEGQDANAILWANVKSNKNEIPAAVLSAPCFDIRYVDRSVGETAKPVEYSLVVTMD
jgi:hypothetical protein